MSCPLEPPQRVPGKRTGKPWQDEPNLIERRYRKQFLKNQKRFEAKIIDLTREYDIRLSATLMQFADGLDGAIPTNKRFAARKALEEEARWYYEELEKLFVKEFSKAIKLALDSEIEANITYLKKAASALGGDIEQRIKELIKGAEDRA